MAIYKNSFILNDKVSPVFKKIVNVSRYADRQLGKSAKTLEIIQRKFENIAKLGNKIKGLGQGLTLGVTLPVVAMGGAMVKAAADIESMQQQLTTMLGSAQKGAKMFDEIKTMAAKTPFETKDLMAATNTMLGFGIAEKKVLPIMQQLGDISGGNADRFQSLALAFSQVSSAGKLQGQDLLQMINAGFNPLEAISKRTGKSIGVLKDEMSKGKITIDMVEQAMKDATSEGGRFFNMMQKQSKTALGQWSTFQDNLNMLLADFGKIILPYAIKGLQKLSNTLEWFNSLSAGAKKTIVVIGGISALIGPLVIGIGGLITAVAGLNTALMFLAANPIVLPIVAIVAAVVGLTVAIVYCWNKFEGFRKMLQGFGAIIKLIGAVIKLVFVATFQLVMNVIKTVISWFQSLFRWISNLPTPILILGKILFGSIYLPLKAIFEITKLVIGGLQKVGGFKGLGLKIKDYADQARGIVNNTTNNITNNTNSGNSTIINNNYGTNKTGTVNSQYVP